MERTHSNALNVQTGLLPRSPQEIIDATACTLDLARIRDRVWRLPAIRSSDQDFYRQRTDRNIGWITPEEQTRLGKLTVGIAGCGGMGGLLAATFARLGIGSLKLADCESFDASNINRQFGATMESIGRNKAMETAKMIRSITDDVQIDIYPDGITDDTAADFANGCAVICDEIEFFISSARILLHQAARRSIVPVFNCNSVGFGTHLFLFTQDSMTIEELIGLNDGPPSALEPTASVNRTPDEEARRRNLISKLAPHLPDYFPGNLARCFERLSKENVASTIATNLPMAIGFCANRILLYLLQEFGFKQRAIVETPAMPGYIYFDSATLETEIVTRPWWEATS